MSGGLPTPEQTDIPIAPTSSKELIPPVILVTQESDAVETPGRVNASSKERTPTTREENGQVRPTLQPVPTRQVKSPPQPPGRRYPQRKCRRPPLRYRNI